MALLYGLVVDSNDGAPEDFNFNYLETHNFELYETVEEREKRYEFLTKLFKLLANGGELDEPGEFASLKFEIDLGRDMPVIPVGISEWAKDNGYAIEVDENEEITVTQTE
jgi:hypothetical protein